MLGRRRRHFATEPADGQVDEHRHSRALFSVDARRPQVCALMPNDFGRRSSIVALGSERLAVEREEELRNALSDHGDDVQRPIVATRCQAAPRPADACEVNTAGDPNNCNACGLACPNHPNSSRTWVTPA